MGVLILLDHQDCFCQSLSTGVFLFKWIRSFQHPQDQVSVLLNAICFIHLQVVFVFSRPPTLFLQGIRCLNQVSFYSCEVSPSFPSMFLSGDSQEDTNGASSSSFFILVFFSGGLISSFGVDHIPFLVSNAFSCRCTS